jgi:hypothetical protein
VIPLYLAQEGKGSRAPGSVLGGAPIGPREPPLQFRPTVPSFMVVPIAITKNVVYSLVRTGDVTCFLGAPTSLHAFWPGEESGIFCHFFSSKSANTRTRSTYDLSGVELWSRAFAKYTSAEFDPYIIRKFHH